MFRATAIEVSPYTFAASSPLPLNANVTPNGLIQSMSFSDSAPTGRLVYACLPTHYKTAPCRSYVHTGRCKFGSKCMYAHGDHELRTVALNEQEGVVTERAVKALRKSQKRFYQELQREAERHAQASSQLSQPSDNHVEFPIEDAFGSFDVPEDTSSHTECVAPVASVVPREPQVSQRSPVVWRHDPYSWTLSNMAETPMSNRKSPSVYSSGLSSSNVPLPMVSASFETD